MPNHLYLTHFDDLSKTKNCLPKTQEINLARNMRQAEAKKIKLTIKFKYT